MLIYHLTALRQFLGMYISAIDLMNESAISGKPPTKGNVLIIGRIEAEVRDQTVAIRNIDRRYHPWFIRVFLPKH